MQNYSLIRRFLYSFACGLLIQSPLPVNTVTHESRIARYPALCQRSQSSPNFLVVGVGGATSYNEIALEKNVLYFQRILRTIGYKLEKDASIFFANGNDGQHEKKISKYMADWLDWGYKMREEQRLNPPPVVQKLMRIKAIKKALKTTCDTPISNRQGRQGRQEQKGFIASEVAFSVIFGDVLKE